MPTNLFNSQSNPAAQETATGDIASDGQDAVSTKPYLIRSPNSPRPEDPKTGVIFLIGSEGHLHNGYDTDVADDLYARSYFYAQRVRAQEKIEKGMNLEIFHFASLEELIAIKTKQNPKKKWCGAILVTHASGVDHPMEEPDIIFFGGLDKQGKQVDYTESDLLDFSYLNAEAISRFRARFDETSPLTLIACGPAHHSRSLVIYVREFFGLRGPVTFPTVPVDFYVNGSLGTPIKKGSKELRPVENEEWQTIPARL